MRIISYLDGGTPGLGVLTSDEEFASVYELDKNLPHTLDGLLRVRDGLERLRGKAAGATGKHRLSEVTFAPLLAHPHGFWALALNFRDHIAETQLTTSEEYPQIFLRVPASFVAPGAPLLAPPFDLARAFDYE